VSADDEWATVRIRDDGDGIPSATRETLFEPPESGDHGYGPFLTNHLVQVYGGRLALGETVRTAPSSSSGSRWRPTTPTRPHRPARTGSWPCDRHVFADQTCRHGRTMSPPASSPDRSSADRSVDSSPQPSRRRFLRAGAGLVGAVGLAGCVISAEPYSETAERSFDPGDADELLVRTDSGDVTLSAGDGAAVSGTVRKASRSGEDALDEVTVEGTVEDGRLTVAPRRPNGNENVTVSLDLSVPEALSVVEASSGNGDIDVDGVGGDGTYGSTNGDVDVTGVDGYVTVESTNGDVEASEVSGLDGAVTTNGDVTVDVPALRDDATCHSRNGDVTAAVTDDLSAAVTLATDNGDATVEGVSMTVESSSEHRIAGTIGEGDHALELSSTNGDVTLLGL